jgi:glycosyltransferase involved in cell wall biosynthesis
LGAGGRGVKVSAIVPTYNRAHLLPRALASIADQTHREIEVVVIDDGSNDETDRIVHGISASFPFLIRYYRQPNGGCASARNLGLKVASGDAVAFLDSDDEWLPDALERLVGALETTQAGFAYSPAIEVDEAGRETLKPPAAARHPERLAREHFECSNLRNGATMFRRSAIDAVGELDEGLHHNEVSDFHQRAAIRCTAAYVDVPSVRVFDHAERKSVNQAAILRALLTSSEKVLEQNPDFAKLLGQRSNQRVEEIRARLLDALILEGDFRAARRLAHEMKTRNDLGQQLALATGSTHPYRFARRVRSAWRRWSKVDEAETSAAQQTEAS